MVGFSSRLRTLRLQHNMTQAQLAERLGLTKSVISAYETYLRMPSYDTLLTIARVFNVSTDYLLGHDMDNTDIVDLSGLSDEEKTAIKELIKVMKQILYLNYNRDKFT